MADEQQTSEQAARRPRRPLAAQQPDVPKNGGALTAETIFSVQDIKRERLDIEEWGGYIWIHSLSSASHEKLVQSCMRGAGASKTFDMIGYQSKLAVLCARDDDGARIFGDEHVDRLGAKASGPISRIATKAQELSGFGPGAIEKAKGNLEQTPSEGLPIA